MKIKHSNDGECLRCKEKLMQACPIMVSWFAYIKASNPEAHISWSYRNEEEQNKMVEENKSKKTWPSSKHNTLDENGQPSSQALDIFQLLDDGGAKFSTSWYHKINDETLAAKLPITWGGNYITLRDYCHFQTI